MKGTEFELTEDHITLLRAMYVDWQYDCEYGAPCISAKRPYGNSDVEQDIAKKLGWKVFEDAYDEKHLSKKQLDLATKIHRDTEIALQIVLRLGTFEPGTYVRSAPYLVDWQRADD